MPEKHINHIKQVLTLLQPTWITLNLKKCFLFTDTIDYLRRIIRPRLSEIAAFIADAIQKLKQPHNIIELRAFLGIWIVFRCLVPSFGRNAAPLNDTL